MNKIKIKVTRDANSDIAWLQDQPEKKTSGSTAAEAVGSLVLTYRSDFNVDIIAVEPK